MIDSVGNAVLPSPALRSLKGALALQAFRADACMYGGHGPSPLAKRRARMLLASSESGRYILRRRCAGDSGHVHGAEVGTEFT